MNCVHNLSPSLALEFHKEKYNPKIKVFWKLPKTRTGCFSLEALKALAAYLLSMIYNV